MTTRTIEPPERGTPSNPFLFSATLPELEWFLVLGLMVAGKKAVVQRRKLQELWEHMYQTDVWLETAEWDFSVSDRRSIENYLLFESLNNRRALYARSFNAPQFGQEIQSLLRAVKTGQYAKLSKSLEYLSHMGGVTLRTISRTWLMRVPGIGMKTASFFIMFTRENADVACLDTHILRFMREYYPEANVPSSTPSHSYHEYIRLEKIFLEFCQQCNRSPAIVDFLLWQRGSRDPLFHMAEDWTDRNDKPRKPGYYYWHIISGDAVGPFETWDHAESALNRYITSYLGLA